MVFLRLCVVGADGRDSRVRAAAFGEVLENSAPAEANDANDANVYYALCPNPPPVTERTDS